MPERRRALGAAALVGVAAGTLPVAAADELGGCSLLPANSIWNTPIDTLPVDPASDAYVATIGASVGLHPDFGTFYRGAPIGIPFVIVPVDQPPVDVTFEYDSESDPGPYPIPADPPIEGGPDSDGDRHILLVQLGADGAACTLHELYSAYPAEDGTWTAGSGARWDLSSNALRPDGWTSADAAGLPILPGLVRYDEVAGGEIRHALRFTCAATRKAHVWPARHDASSSTDPARPPMGQRFRLKSFVNVNDFPAEVRPIVQAMKTYGLILADNGSNWYVTGTHDTRWDDDALSSLAAIKGWMFEAVDVSSLMVDPDSGEAASTIIADLNGDRLVDGADVAMLLAVWGSTRPTLADLNQDGVVSGPDLTVLLANWS